MAEEIIRETISVTRTNISEEDKELASDYNAFIRRALREGHKILRFGTPDQKLRLVTSSINAASRLAAIDSKSEVEEQRREYEHLMSNIRDVPNANEIEAHVVPHSLAQPANDQNQDVGDEAV